MLALTAEPCRRLADGGRARYRTTCPEEKWARVPPAAATAGHPIR